MRLVRVVLGVAVSLAAIIVLIGTVDVSQVGSILVRLDPHWLLPALAVVVLQFLLRAVRWRGLLAATTLGSPDLTAAAAALAVGYLGNAVLPARLGEVARTIFVSSREQLDVAKVTASVVLERSIDVVALATIASVAASASPSGGPVLFAAAIPLLPLALLGARAIASRLGPPDPALRFTQALSAIGRFVVALAAARANVVVAAYALSFLAWLGDMVIFWSCAGSLGVQVTPTQAIGLGVGAALATAVPSAGGYIGTYEFAIVAVGTAYRIRTPALLPAALVAHVVAVVPPALFGAAVTLRAGATWRTRSRAGVMGRSTS